MNTKEMIAVMQAYEDGKQIEINCNGDTWVVNESPAWNWGHCEYRIKPTRKPVDLSVLVDSGIDCEFCNSASFLLSKSRVGKLVGTSNTEYIALPARTFQYCRPRMSHIHAVRKKGHADNLIRKLYEAGFEITYSVVTYGIDGVYLVEFNGLLPDYCYPWECDNAAS